MIWIRRLLLTGYVLAWSIVLSGLALMPVSLIAESMNRRWHIDDDWSWLGIPLGAIIGGWFAIRTRCARLMHIASILGGTVAAIILFWRSSRLAERGLALTGVHGPFSGFAEQIGSLLYFLLASMAAIAATAGGLGLLLREIDRRQLRANQDTDSRGEASK